MRGGVEGQVLFRWDSGTLEHTRVVEGKTMSSKNGKAHTRRYRVPRLSFLQGMASTVDLVGYGAPPYSRSDLEALRSDWRAVGGDLRRAAAKR